jgi:hypothetical protein
MSAALLSGEGDGAGAGAFVDGGATASCGAEVEAGADVLPPPPPPPHAVSAIVAITNNIPEIFVFIFERSLLRIGAGGSTRTLAREEYRRSVARARRAAASDSYLDRFTAAKRWD